MKARKGSVLFDALVGLIILILGLIPISSSILFAYAALNGSVEITSELNELYDEVEKDILERTLDPTYDIWSKFPGISPSTLTIDNTASGYGKTTAELRYKDAKLQSSGRSGVSIKIYIIRPN